MTRSMWLWLAAGASYAVFCWWYTNTGGALTDAEIEQFTQIMQERGTPPERIARMRRFMGEDDGDQFLMVNVIDVAREPVVPAHVPANETAADLLARYMAHMYPALAKRASHPTFAGEAIFSAMDLTGMDGIDHAERWTDAAVMRYRSRRDILEISMAPEFADKHVFKVAALDKTIAFPVQPRIYLSDARLLLLLALLAIVSLIDRFLLRR